MNIPRKGNLGKREGGDGEDEVEDNKNFVWWMSLELLSDACVAKGTKPGWIIW